eukprot:m.672783 g.672783  ORF g.672783 m.672783 type:complete len:396 (-) comp58535_c0_seq62:45-1232(-)
MLHTKSQCTNKGQSAAGVNNWAKPNNKNRWSQHLTKRIQICGMKIGQRRVANNHAKQQIGSRPDPLREAGVVQVRIGNPVAINVKQGAIVLLEKLEHARSSTSNQALRVWLCGSRERVCSNGEERGCQLKPISRPRVHLVLVDVLRTGSAVGPPPSAVCECRDSIGSHLLISSTRTVPPTAHPCQLPSVRSSAATNIERIQPVWVVGSLQHLGVEEVEIAITKLNSVVRLHQCALERVPPLLVRVAHVRAVNGVKQSQCSTRVVVADRIDESWLARDTAVCVAHNLLIDARQQLPKRVLDWSYPDKLPPSVGEGEVSREGLEESADLRQVTAVHDVLKVHGIGTPGVVLVVHMTVRRVHIVADNIDRRNTVLHSDHNRVAKENTRSCNKKGREIE